MFNMQTSDLSHLFTLSCRFLSLLTSPLFLRDYNLIVLRGTDMEDRDQR